MSPDETGACMVIFARLCFYVFRIDFLIRRVLVRGNINGQRKITAHTYYR